MKTEHTEKLSSQRELWSTLWPRVTVEALEFRRAPVLVAACWFAAGEALTRRWLPASVLLIALVLLCGLLLLALRRSLRIAAFPLAAVWIVVGFWCAQMQPAPSTQQALLSYTDGLSRTVVGRVVRVRELPPRAPAKDQDKEPGWWVGKEEAEAESAVGAVSLDLQVEEIEYLTPDISRLVPISGGVRVNIVADKAHLGDTSFQAFPEFHCGDVVEAPMRLREPERYHDPGAWQYADYLLAQGLGAHATVRASKISLLGNDASALPAKDGGVRLADKDWSAEMQCEAYAAQSWASSRVLHYVNSRANRSLPATLRLNTDDAGMLNAMLFGDRVGLNQTLRVGFERTGSFHLFVVSGMHVALLAGIIFWLTRRLRLGEWIATLTTLAFTSGYAILTGFGAPVQRALFMTAVFLIARLLSRDRNVLNALGVAALAVLVWSPNALFGASFQMTFLAIMAIAGIAVPLGERSFLPYAQAARKLDDEWLDIAFAPPLQQFRVMLRLWCDLFAQAFGRWSRKLPATVARWTLWTLELVLIGLVVEMVMALPMAIYFHRATMFALPTNMLSVPLVAILAPMAIVTFCAMLLNPWAAILPGSATALLLHGVTTVIGRVSAVHAANLRVPAPVWWISALAVAAWAFCCWAVRRSRGWAWITVGLLPVIVALVLWPESQIVPRGTLEVTAIDVGQGDSIFVAGPTGKTMLIDAGGPVGGINEVAAATSRFDVGEDVVSAYLWSRRIRHLDILVLSHAHSDHMGGMPAVMQNFRPRELWVSIDPNSEAYRALLTEAQELGVTVRHFYAGAQMSWDGTQIIVLAPQPGYTNGGEPVNDDSLVLRMQYGRSSVLLEGDAEAPSEDAMLASGRMRPVTLLKVGHHGSKTSTTPAFLAAADPKDAVISVGKGNTFGHPRFEVLQRIEDEHARLYRTDEFGATTFLLDELGGIREASAASN
ncbi:DNA internalization-related competence protein ComEC/Rec2 [Edaphobacter acidisoli]|uniref:DNA internalization-related competence protein ComEC/Rec2 n=1 Tax=Edaphobacter acidisoli TaxID=2040573 RepID=A0A916RRL9_9BACT|nr:ComEC/Rec2 family competence protein [Edaphobacter acidisoli]GGA66896.1 DNA internalization-related competence protein ComEC/Rec2 [Edaphobacter acidisoli]